MSEYTPTTEQVREAYATRNAPAQDLERRAAFDRWMAAHDKALREQIAQECEVEMRRHDAAQVGFSAVGDAYAHAAHLIREGGRDATRHQAD